MEEKTASIALESIKTRRRILLPWWVKIFCWFFMIFGFLSFACLLLGFTNIKPAFAFYGFETNEPFSLYGLLIIFVGLIKGYTAFLIWYEKDIAIKMGKIDAIIGIVLCGISMLILPFFDEGFKVTFRIEIVLLILYLIKLIDIKKEWKNIH